VIRKGNRAWQQLPASPDASVWLRLYQAELVDLVPPGPDQPLWWTLRQPLRALNYHAARAMFIRANAALGSNWTLHDLRHTAAYRMARDPQMALTEALLLWGGVRKRHRRLPPDQTESASSANAVASRWRGSTSVASS
jgi:integrase